MHNPLQMAYKHEVRTVLGGTSAASAVAIVRGKDGVCT